jgi:hypothetical protein
MGENHRDIICGKARISGCFAAIFLMHFAGLDSHVRFFILHGNPGYVKPITLTVFRPGKAFYAGDA